MHNPWQRREPDIGIAGSFLAGLVVGGLAGAGAMLLLAPQSGERTRAEIQQKGMELRDQTVETVENTMADARIKARQITDPARKQAEQLQQHDQETYEEQRNLVSPGADWVAPR